MAGQGEKDPEYREYQEYQRLEDCEEDSPPGEDEEELLLHVTEGPTGTGVLPSRGPGGPCGPSGGPRWESLSPRFVAPHQGPGQFLYQDILAWPLEALWGNTGVHGRTPRMGWMAQEGPSHSHKFLNLTYIYHFHQRNGFACVVLSDVLELVQFLFVVTFSTFLLCCVDYDVLFATRPLNQSHVPEHSKVTLPDAVLPAPQCARRLRGSGWLLFLLVLAGMVWLCRLVTALRRLVGYWEIRRFYIQALGIPADELCNHSWQSVQARLLALQRRQPLCVPRRELTELDIHHRILRFRNYTVAMVNKSLLPVHFHLPLLGPVVFLTRGLQFNLELLLFRGPAALFQNTWSLRPQVKRAGTRRALARGLARAAVLLGVANLALCPCVLGWRLLLAFFSYAEGLKRAPGSLGARRWSLYARHYLRHFNELGHELQARLSRGHAPATKYMDSFSSPLLAVLARHVGFFAGSVLAVLIVLTVYDEDVLTVQHILTAITLLGLVVTVARSFIPDEHSVWCPEQLLQRVLAHVHYLPEHWQGRAGRAETRAEMAQLFQYKAVGVASPPSTEPSSFKTPFPGTLLSTPWILQSGSYLSQDLPPGTLLS
ncbi:Autophagy-related protein 9A [Willisornis vidua]|uniref:Autophagy-related protein 9 n=1 Tax=Willisornis vidua TaxID=1566151 RepID=A0ABQ9CYT6_9PASS|nr:Autophagy-related protein 9A [Willisornis vidua]